MHRYIGICIGLWLAGYNNKVLTPFFPGIAHSQIIRLSVPSVFLNGLATNPCKEEKQKHVSWYERDANGRESTGGQKSIASSEILSHGSISAAAPDSIQHEACLQRDGPFAKLSVLPRDAQRQFQTFLEESENGARIEVNLSNVKLTSVYRHCKLLQSVLIKKPVNGFSFIKRIIY